MTARSNSKTALIDKGKKKVKATMLEHLQHKLSIFDITHSKYNIFAYLLKPITILLGAYEAVRCNQGDYIYRKKLTLGDNFVCAGGLWMCDFDTIKSNLITPQARAFKLAPSPLDPKHLPRSNLPHKRMTFLLSLSQEGAGGNGDWEAYRGAVNDYITNPKCVNQRMSPRDQTAQKLVDNLTQEYKKACAESGSKELSEEESLKFHKDSDAGLLDFLMRYLHYVLFGLDPFDEEIMKPINDFHYDEKSAAYYLAPVGNLKFKFKKPKNLEAVAKIYENSPSISAMEEGQAKYKNMTRRDLALLMTSIMSLAGMVGPKTLAYIVLGVQGLPDYDGETTADIKVREKWDKINLDNREEVKKYMYECGRLRHAVSNTHKVALEDFTARVGRKDIKFKKGTIIYIPMLLAGLDKSVYGEDTFDFNPQRKNLCPYSTLFHSFGEQTNGRICPGKAVAEHMIVEMLIALGKVRQGMD